MSIPWKLVELTLAELTFAFLGFAFALASAAVTCAADYPSRPIHLIVPYAAGGAADSVARVVAKQIGKAEGQTIVVENRGGGGSIIGTEFVSAQDSGIGHLVWQSWQTLAIKKMYVGLIVIGMMGWALTLLLGQSGPISINPAVYKKIPYDPEKDFAPICLTTSYPYIMV